MAEQFRDHTFQDGFLAEREALVASFEANAAAVDQREHAEATRVGGGFRPLSCTDGYREQLNQRLGELWDRYVCEP